MPDDRDPPPAPPPVPLSGREAGALRLLAWGFTNKEIAGRLGLSVKTVETYKTRGLRKLGLRSRVDLVVYAVRHGWLTPAGPPLHESEVGPASE